VSNNLANRFSLSAMVRGDTGVLNDDLQSAQRTALITFMLSRTSERAMPNLPGL
jgi:hypothetical protein